MRDEPRSGCPINAAVEALGDKWSLIVLRDVIFGARRHFRDLLAHSEEGIASNILASRLKALVAGGLLSQEQAGRGRRATYSLTEAGIQTVPVMAVLGSWGLRHRPVTPALSVRAQLLETGGPPLWADLMDELRETHLGIPRPDPARPLPSESFRAAYHRALESSATRPPDGPDGEAGEDPDDDPYRFGLRFAGDPGQPGGYRDR